jgi:hypothetical protein
MQAHEKRKAITPTTTFAILAAALAAIPGAIAFEIIKAVAIAPAA